jgi:hypothetical protein
MKKLAFAAIVFSLILSLPWNVSAQGEQVEYRAELFKPDVSQFPTVSANMAVYQPEGGFVHGLDRDSVFMLEDGASLKVETIQEIRIGMQVSVVINAGPGFANRNSKGISRFDSIKDYLNAWAEDQKEIAIDDLGLFTNSGIQQTHLTNSQAWQTAFATYQPDLKKSVPRLEELGAAIQNAQDTSASKPIHKAIFYFTALPGKEMTETVMDDLIDRANQADTQVFIWMLSSKGDFDSPESGFLRTIAERTGGQFFAFSGTETFPEAKTILEPLRFLYQLSYQSNVQKGGQHNLAVRINLQDATVSSTPTAFEIDLLPVNPIFVGIPAAIQRTVSNQQGESAGQLLPSNLLVEFLVEYPDHLERELAQATLWVDGEKAAANTAAPFTRFVWDLSPYQESGRHTIQVTVTDSLGISAESNSLPVQIDVIIPEPTSWQKIIQGQGIYFIFAGIFLLGLATAYLVIRVRARGEPGILEKRSVSHGSTRVEQALIQSDPTQPPAEKGKKQASCRLLTRELDETDEPPILLGDSPMRWGKARDQVTIWIDDDALADLHCTVAQNDQGLFVLTDNHTELGTWVNFQPVPAQGVVLDAGDLIQVGDFIYRFEEGSRSDPGKVTIIPYNNY